MSAAYVHVDVVDGTQQETDATITESATKKRRISSSDLRMDYCAELSAAESLIPKLGELWRERRVEFRVHGKTLNGRKAEDIARTFRSSKAGSTRHACEIVDAIQKSKGSFAGYRFDIGKMMEGGSKSLIEKVAAAEDKTADKSVSALKQTDVVLYGFGRIGRLIARMLLSTSSSKAGPVLRAIVVRKKKFDDLPKRAELLLHDTVHGEFGGHVSVDTASNSIIANGHRVKIIYSNGPDQLDYTKFGISNAVVVDNTGIWRDAKGLSLHLQSKGTSKVVLTAPGKGVPNVVYGVNDAVLRGDERVVSAASCSTNAAVPVLNVLNDAFGILSGHIETVHSFTNDQNIIDNLHKKPRRGRAAPVNIILTSTGAGKAVAKCVPDLDGKLTASAIRVPTPDVSILVMNLQLKTAVSREKVNEILERAAKSKYSDQIDFVRSEDATSSDFVGNAHASIVDGNNTIAKGNGCVVYVWYDNEYGYSCQTFRLLRKLCGDAPVDYPTAL
eukprot:g636.t1